MNMRLGHATCGRRGGTHVRVGQLVGDRAGVSIELKACLPPLPLDKMAPVYGVGMVPIS